MVCKYTFEGWGRMFKRSTRHMDSHNGENKFTSVKCLKAFKRKGHATRHKRNCNGKQQEAANGRGLKRRRTTTTHTKTAFSRANITWKLVDL